MKVSKPYAGSALSVFVARRVLELAARKSQAEIATETGFPNPNVLSMVKNGASKLPLDRVPALARALDCDPARLFRLALEQGGNETTQRAIEEVFGAIVSRNKSGWLQELRLASNHSDPTLTLRARSAIRGIFGK